MAYKWGLYLTTYLTGMILQAPSDIHGWLFDWLIGYKTRVLINQSTHFQAIKILVVLL